MAVRRKGIIRNWSEERGFGFITPISGGKDVFLHISSLQHRSRKPKPGESVDFRLSKDKQNRLCAIDATFDGEKLKSKQKQRRGLIEVVVSALFLLTVSAFVATGNLPTTVLWLYLVGSLATIIFYWKDKSAARNGQWRTPESTLHFMALLGGWPGALIAQAILRHKSKKTSFRAVFFVTVFLNVAALLWSLTPAGSALLDKWLHFLL